MKKVSRHAWRVALAKVLAVVMLITSVMALPPNQVKAMTSPTLSKSTRNILIGKQYNLDVKNKVKNSTYQWSSGNKKIATVTQRGVVTGVSSGETSITCKVTTPKDVYTLSCKVTIIRPASKLKISNKVTALNVGQKYNLNRTLVPSTSNDKTKWTSSDTTIASPDKNGKFTALKEGTVTITGTTLSGATDSNTILVVDADGTAENQEELEALLGSGVSVISIKTAEEVTFTIPKGDYSGQKLVVDAPNADVINNGLFSSINIKQIKASTFWENAIGNHLNVQAPVSRIVIGAGASASVTVSQPSAEVTLVNNGTLSGIEVSAAATLAISGTSSGVATPVPVTINAAGVVISASMPLNVICNQSSGQITLLEGAQGSTIRAASMDILPVIMGEIEPSVVIGEGSSEQRITVTPIPTPQPAVPTAAPTPIPTTTPVSTVTPVPTAVPTQGDTVFNELNQSDIVEAMSPGWNLGNQLEASLDGVPGETAWGNPVITEKLIKAVKAAGFKSIRIPVSYLSYIGDAPDYTINKEWLNRIQEVVNYCVKNDIYAIINVHGDGYDTVTGGWLIPKDEDQATIKAKYEAVWEQIATRFKDYDEHLIFESMNEVGGYDTVTTAVYDNINAYNQIFLDTIRQTGGNNDKRWVLIPGWLTDIDKTTGNMGFKLPTDTYLSSDVPEGENRIMISVHYYTPWSFCGSESGDITQWGANATNVLKADRSSGESLMAAQFEKLYNTFTSEGYPVIVGEYGSIDKSEYDAESADYRAYFAQKICENSLKYGCIPVIWDNGYNGKYGFAYFDRSNATVTQPKIVAAIMEVYNPSDEEGTSTAISLDKETLTMKMYGAAQTLHTVLTPGDSEDTIKWSSSDEKVATVSNSGVVKAFSLGTAIITASANGHQAQCTVTVEESANVMVELVAYSANWSSATSLDCAEITEDGGTFTLTATGSEDLMSKLVALYLKDIRVESGMATSSKATSAKILINSVKLNGVACTVNQTTAENAISSSGVLNFDLINIWAAMSKINEVELVDANQDYYRINAADYQDVNTIEVTFTVSDVTISDNSTTPTPTPGAEDPDVTTIPISSVKYDFEVAGVTNETSLTFNAQDTNWKGYSEDIALNGDGNYSVTINMENVSGLTNLGYFTQIEGSGITAKLTKVTVNGEYELTASGTAQVGTANQNGYANIWNTNADTKVAEGSNAYLEVNSEKSGINFYVVEEEEDNTPTVTPISSIKYDFTVAGITNETSLTFNTQDTNWKGYSEDIALNGDGTYSVTITIENVNGLTNLGYFTQIEGSGITATLTKVTVNGTYELTASGTAQVGTANQNGYANIWNTNADTKVAEGSNSYMEVNSEKSGIIFYVIG